MAGGGHGVLHSRGLQRGEVNFLASAAGFCSKTDVLACEHAFSCNGDNRRIIECLLMAMQE